MLGLINYLRKIGILKKIKELIFKGDFEEARKSIEKYEYNYIKDTFILYTYETENISIYSFAMYMYNIYSEIIWLKIAIDILIYSLNHLEGAYSVALFHSRELLKKQKNVENMDRMLFFYNLPDELISYKEAENIANEILKLDPDNEIAISVLKENRS